MLRTQVYNIPKRTTSLNVRPFLTAVHYLHTSSIQYDKNNGQRSPIQVFRDTFKNEWKKSQELQDNIKTLQDASGKLGESDAYKKAKEAYIKAQKGSTIVGKTLKKTGETVEDIAVKAWESDIGKKTREVANDTAKKLDESFEPVRKTQVYKDVSDVINDGSSSTRYGGFITKEERQRLREKALASGERVRAVKSNDEAGTALVSTNIQAKESFGKKIDDFSENTTVGQGLSFMKTKLWNESENPMIVVIRKISNKIGGFFAETESAKVYSQFKLMDPTFNSASFTKHLREYIVPEILEAYIKGDQKVLKKWLSEAPFNVYAAQQKVFREQQIFSDGRMLDIRNVEIVSAKLLQPQDIPVLVISCRAQEINLYRKSKTGEIAAGSEDNILMSTYAMVFTRDPEQIDDDETEGWKILEFVRGGSRQFT
ncbi:similar to Saccharomyces cerevisiae YIL022W TIM44 Essential component of the Translocase of the Inner Mitochondrial membrane (TIM23 complex) [Maudiozyma barnettii]|uniref:Mitochondrial import inner membrane translocase subunit TIM44 n=1 Tax=Maudiozyma barnettii TaxID=61262 RepID=A0A8H2VHZ6_9SACH|nr:protein translocase subunit TIM44 [Kazachstania barnettii]CAB4255745.1 similar to Saccharomyces cerevisiae YIL022W TIM44 Essential component of the Translocase of the Inner Mitochondrial membrane (TIM23 complex) [Kazachstania barnettii]CAD1784306.1 similar to Saccharomyces cerevisiae YIL022W TIM44 Essential component of the Translocase of the Inner Mitochondrial membrane (TIM23 complex) [Kazachstania barnettii]